MADYGLDSFFRFGKYIGEQVEDVIEDDPRYIAWLVSENVVNFDEETMELITKLRIV